MSRKKGGVGFSDPMEEEKKRGALGSGTKRCGPSMSLMSDDSSGKGEEKTQDFGPKIEKEGQISALQKIKGAAG